MVGSSVALVTIDDGMERGTETSDEDVGAVLLESLVSCDVSAADTTVEDVIFEHPETP